MANMIFELTDFLIILYTGVLEVADYESEVGF